MIRIVWRRDWLSSELYKSRLNGSSSWVSSSTACFAGLFFENVTSFVIQGIIISDEVEVVSLYSLCNGEGDGADGHVAFAFIIEVVPVVSELVCVIPGDVELSWFEGVREVTTDTDWHVGSVR